MKQFNLETGRDVVRAVESEIESMARWSSSSAGDDARPPSTTDPTVMTNATASGHKSPSSASGSLAYLSILLGLVESQLVNLSNLTTAGASGGGGKRRDSSASCKPERKAAKASSDASVAGQEADCLLRLRNHQDNDNDEEEEEEEEDAVESPQSTDPQQQHQAMSEEPEGNDNDDEEEDATTTDDEEEEEKELDFCLPTPIPFSRSVACPFIHSLILLPCLNS